MQEVECEGKTVAEAVEAALKKLGLRRDQAEVKIIQEAKSGFMGLGSKLAKVKVGEKKWMGTEAEEPARPAPQKRPENGTKRAQREKPAVPEPSVRLSSVPGEAERTRGAQAVSQLLKLMGCDAAQVEIAWEEKQERLKVSITGDAGERLVSEDGKALDSLQMIANLILNRRPEHPKAVDSGRPKPTDSGSFGRGTEENRFLVHVDALGWREKKEKETLGRIELAVEEVKRTNKPCRLDPMDAATRRVIHKQLADHPDVVTASEGEGTWRKIVIRPRKG